MFYSLTGKLDYAADGMAVVNCGGVGFQCAVTRSTLAGLPPAGGTVTLFTHLNVREDALDLFGFADKSELEFFRLLTGISGVGPKAALAILSELTPEKLAVCIMSGDSKAITRAQGVGAKIAQRVVMELKDKLGAADLLLSGEDAQAAGAASASSNAADAVSALVALGYQRSDASLAVGRLDSSLDTEELIRQALKSLGKMKL